jgi:hypothetical protein
MLSKLNLEKNIQFPQATETFTNNKSVSNGKMDSHLNSVNPVGRNPSMAGHLIITGIIQIDNWN